MAKDNLFLGFGRGKVGDVVFYRRDGQQIARARNRAPRNPNTFRQQLQRAVSANVQRLYSAGMQVFNHSFEGFKVGEGNQRVFVKKNMDKLRSLLVSDYNLSRSNSDCLGRIGAPGLSIPVPFDGLIISNGSVQQTVFTFDDTDGFTMPDPLRTEQEAINETVGNYALRVGLVPGDIYTFVAFGCDPLQGAELAYFGPLDSYTVYASVFSQLFGFCQLRVKEGVTTVSDPISNSTTLAAFFEAGQEGVDLTGRNMLLAISQQAIDRRMVSGLIGCIRSREDSGVRSPSEMHVMRSAYDWGVTVNYLENAWGSRSAIDGSDLLLEGSDFATSGVTVAPKVFDCEDNHQITAVGVGFIPGTADGVAYPAIPVVIDDQGNNYFIKCTDTELKSYGAYLKRNGSVDVWGDDCWAAAITGATTANTVKTYEKGPDSWWSWLFNAGISPYVILEQT